MANRFLPFARWIWSKRNLDVAFRQSTVTQDNVAADASLPLPPLSGLEAIQFFRFLEDKELIFPLKGDPNAYAVNAVETYKWEKIFEELGKPDWKRSWWFERFKSGFMFFVIAIISGLLGGASVKLGEDGIDRIKEWFGQKPSNTAAQKP